MSYLIGVNLTEVATGTPSHTEGSVYTADTGNKYKYVKLLNESATVAGAAGDVAGYLGSPGATENNTVVTDNTDAATKPIGAGVILATVAGVPGTPEWIWVQVTGPFTANNNIAGTTPADGDALMLGATDKVLTLVTAVDDPVCAYATDDSADKCMAAFAH